MQRRGFWDAHNAHICAGDQQWPTRDCRPNLLARAPFDILFHCLQARETGICPVREELYSQCLDELIRQVTISCAERGLLLLRVRDEMRMTTAAYQVRCTQVQLQLGLHLILHASIASL